MQHVGPSASVLRLFAEAHVAQLTGLSVGQLRSWDRAGFFSPDHGYDEAPAAYNRVYSFRDVVGLRTIAILRKKHKISLQELKRVAKELALRGYEHWAETKLYVVNGQVHFQHPETGEVEGIWDRQLAMLDVIDVINDVVDQVAQLRNRPEDKVGHIERHRHVARNTWVVGATRIPTATIRRYREAGYSDEQILREYPSLTEADISAALDHEERLAKSA